MFSRCFVISNMSSPDPTRESSSVPALNNDTLITINLNQSNTAATTTTTTVPPTTAVIAEPSNDEANSSIGSQRSLNSRLFPFRFSRDILLNNVSIQRLHSVIAHLMTHPECFFLLSRSFKRFDHWCKTQAPQMRRLLHGCAAPSTVFTRKTNTPPKRMRHEVKMLKLAVEVATMSSSTLDRHRLRLTRGRTQHPLVLAPKQGPKRWAQPVQISREHRYSNTKARTRPTAMARVAPKTILTLKTAAIHSHKFRKLALSSTPSLDTSRTFVFSSRKAATTISTASWISLRCSLSLRTQILR